MYSNSPKCQTCVECDIRSPLFHLLSKEELQNLNQDRYEVEYKAGDIIFKQGSAANNILSLTRGKVKLYLEGVNGNKLTFKIAKRWELLGGPGLFIDNRHHYTARALENVTVCFINLERFKAVIRTNVAFGDLFWKQVNLETVHLYSRFLSNAQKQMHGRLADALLYLSSEVFTGENCEIIIGKQDIAELSGMTRDNVVRVLKRFVADDIIEILDKEIKIINRDKLLELSRLG
ncbi:MAG: Crp/Fnr family transcriptional regulator [Bacteroidales bacterium]|nr:Crp/Fnr family transcriptional regulator [Bacteroidales bacterium]